MTAPATTPVLPRWMRWPKPGVRDQQKQMAGPLRHCPGGRPQSDAAKAADLHEPERPEHRPAAAFYKIPRNHIIVLCDDIAQEPGHIRIRPSGSAGGHNGLKSIIASTGGEDFYRIRIGVGAKPRPDYDLADWVLGKFPPDDAKLVTGRHTDVEAACRLLMAGKLGEAQNKFNH